MNSKEIDERRKRLEYWIAAAKDMIEHWQLKLDSLKMKFRCGSCSHWEISMQVGHNLGVCDRFPNTMCSRFSRICSQFDYTPNNPPEMVYGEKYRSEEL